MLLENSQKVAMNAQWRGKLIQVAHQYVKDTFHTTLCLQFRPQVIAVSAMFLASQFIEVRLSRLWWRQLPGNKHIDRKEVISCCHQILEVFEEKKRSRGISASQ